MNSLWLLLLVVGVSWITTGLVRRYAVAKSLIDVPNERSSHSEATPRGGGISIVIAFLGGLIMFWFFGGLRTGALIAFSGAGIIAAVIGFIDDHGHIAARWRLLGHVIAASWLVFWLGGLPQLTAFGLILDAGWIGHLIAIIALVWLLNLYNFMDGIDGLAGVEALSSTLVIALILLLAFDDPDMLFLYMLMAAAVIGFLVWNFPPAKIFMGDAGSGFVGLMLGALALYGAHVDTVVIWVWLVMLGVFIVDSTFTLLRRLLRGDKIYEAHRTHAYQYASRKYGSHLSVTLSVVFINIFWLAPWALGVALGAVDGAAGLILAYIPLLILALLLHAGEAEKAS